MEWRLLKVEKREALVTVLIDNPPINLITLDLYRELSQFVEKMTDEKGVSVILFKSANPDFFIAHFDVSAILKFPLEGEVRPDPELNAFHLMCERLRNMEKVTIAQIEGRVGGGGGELVASMDMRFGVKNKTILNQMEVPLGILPGGSGTQRLPRIIGRGRAIEVILGAEDIDSVTLENWGFLNRLYEPDEIEEKVATLARRISLYPNPAVRLAKRSINNHEMPFNMGLQQEAYLFQQLLRTEEAPKAMTRFLLGGGQTKEGELRVAELSLEINESGVAVDEEKGD
tara:strand:+ start:460 stop:1317 length:858 start_codon:yes stop_codon:yes gene_type:complete